MPYAAHLYSTSEPRHVQFGVAKNVLVGFHLRNSLDEQSSPALDSIRRWNSDLHLSAGSHPLESVSRLPAELPVHRVEIRAK